MKHFAVRKFFGRPNGAEVKKQQATLAFKGSQIAEDPGSEGDRGDGNVVIDGVGKSKEEAGATLSEDVKMVKGEIDPSDVDSDNDEAAKILNRDDEGISIKMESSNGKIYPSLDMFVLLACHVLASITKLLTTRSYRKEHVKAALR